MKKFTALLLVLAMLLPACASATDTDTSATSSQLTSTIVPTAVTTTAEPTIPTDTLTTIPATDNPVTDAPATNTPTTVVPTTNTPTTVVPTTDTLTTDTSTTNTPTTNTPTTNTPITNTPTTNTPTTNTPTTVTPTPSTDAPVTIPSPTTTTKPPVTTEKPVTTEPHSHSYGAWRTVKAATCTAAGSEMRTCACGNVETRSIAAIGHSYGAWKVTKAATCTAAGIETRTCACGNKETRSIAAIGHSYGAWKVTKAATCTAEGIETRTCAACGNKETRSIAATGLHSWSAWKQTKEATYMKEGEETRTCSGCNKQEKRSIDKLEAVIDIPATPTLQNLFPIDNLVHATFRSSTVNGFSSNENADKLFDSDPFTKFATGESGYTIEWKLDKASNICAYSLQMANDTATYDRRPTAWTIEASTDGKTWKTVSNVTNGGLPKVNYEEKIFALTAGEYQYFRFTLKAPTGAQTQMSEITLYTNEIPATPALDATLGRDPIDNSANITAGVELVKRMIDDYYNRTTHIVGEQPGNTGSTTLWPATSFVEAVAEAYRACPDDPYIYSTYIDWLNNCLPLNFRVEATITTPNRGKFDVVYYNAVANSRGDYYYDDDAWVCLQLLNAYDLLGDERYLELAKESLEFLWTGWDEEFGGGIYWDKRYFCKNTCANGPIAIAFLRAYELTGKTDYLNKGKQLYDWMRNEMLQGNLYCDNIGYAESNGVIDYGGEIKLNSWKAAYNQGTPMAAGALLYRITGEKRYLTETTAVWNATIDLMFLGDDDNPTMFGNPIYKAWCVGWLVKGFMMYYEVDPDQKTEAMDKMLSVLEDERGTVNFKGNTGYYDPYFLSGDWQNQSMTEVLQPSGVATTFILSGFYELLRESE